MTSRRLPEGGSWIDRSKPITFRFDGVEYEGFEGDTLASALLANGVTGGFRSPILGRPRGIMTAGPEEPNAFVEVSEPWFDPIVAATMVELVDGLVAEPRAGVGRLPASGPQSPVAERRHVHVETLVIGGGPSGRAAAEMAASRGDRVLLVDERHRIDDPPDGVTVLPRTTALGVYDDGYVVAHERSVALGRLWHIRAGHVVLATGATERPIAFAGNDRPGVMLASAAATYVERFGVLVDDQVSLLTTNDGGRESLGVLETAGADPQVIDLRDAGEASRITRTARCSLPEAGRRTSRSGARSAARSGTTTTWRASFRTKGPRGSRSSAVPPARTSPARPPCGSSTAIGPPRSSTCSGTRRSPTSRRRSRPGSRPSST